MVDHVMTSSPKQLKWARLGVIGGMLLCTTGCEKLMRIFKSKNGEAAPQTLPTTQSAVTLTRPAVLSNETLATVNGVPISKADLELRVQELKALTANLNQPWTALTTEQLSLVLNELVNSELMSQDAAARGLHRALEAQRHWEFLRRGFLAQEWLSWNQQRLEVASADVEQYYEQNKQGFREPDQIRVRQIVVTSEDQAKQALAKLLGESMDFTALAQQISVAPTAAQGGMLAQWVMRANEKAFRFPTEADAAAAGVTSLDPVLEAAAFAIDRVNGLSSYVKGPDSQYHIFQLVERKEGRQRPISEVWDQIKNFLLIQKLQGAVDELNRKAKIERFAERLQEVSQ